MLSTPGKILYLLKLIFAHRSSWYSKLLVLLGVVYLLFPADLILDTLPFLGLLDDLSFLSLFTWLAYLFMPLELKQILRSRFNR
ncbi:MAG: DUF1232 domain-containing protein [Proteobacteria bacterium]|nr:DUF1232 domain-containing protein [Pseudomonadota bacterium]MBU1737491.1 DUF1232 domain-containing protein [Pseudomonadota bacterium]